MQTILTEGGRAARGEGRIAQEAGTDWTSQIGVGRSKVLDIGRRKILGERSMS